MVSWASAALLVAILFGLINNLDSHLINKRMPGPRTFLLLFSLLVLLVIIPLAIIFPLSSDIQTGTLVSAIASALMRAFAVVIMLFAFKTNEVVGVVPLVYSYPVFVAIMAAPLLGETLQWMQWLAIFMVVAGAFLVALRPRINGVGQWLGKSFPLLVMAALLFAGADVSGKYALEEISSINMYWISMLALVIINLSFSLRISVIKSVKNIKNPRSTLIILLVNETLVVFASLTTFWAIQNGPVSLVSAIIASRPVFVFIIALLLSRLFPGFVFWQSNKRTLRFKFIAILLIVMGISIIYVV